MQGIQSPSSVPELQLEDCPWIAVVSGGPVQVAASVEGDASIRSVPISTSGEGMQYGEGLRARHRTAEQQKQENKLFS